MRSLTIDRNHLELRLYIYLDTLDCGFTQRRGAALGKVLNCGL